MSSLEEENRSAGFGPLAGLRALELGGIGPGPFCGMLLADLGVEVIRIERPHAVGTEQPHEVLNRGRQSLALDLKAPQGKEIALRLAARSDIVFEGFRPGVAERLGVGPEDCMERNERLVYGRMTGWGQEGPLAGDAGHDINYIALAGALDVIGPRGGPPVPPLNLLGDFGGGGTFLALGLVSAVWEASRTGKGQVVDASVVDGTASLMGMLMGMYSAGEWQGGRGENFLDGGAHFYGVYECADGLHVSVGAIEPQFYEQFLAGLQLQAPADPDRMEPGQWPVLREKVTRAFLSRTREEWLEEFSTRDACITPVLTLEEAREHSHNKERQYIQEHKGILQPGAAPRFERTPGQGARAVPRIGEHTEEILRGLGSESAEIEELRAAGVLG